MNDKTAGEVVVPAVHTPPPLLAELCLRLAAFASFPDWLNVWRPACRSLAVLGPCWYAEAAPGAGVCVLGPGEDLQAALEGSARGAPPPSVLVLLPGSHQRPLQLARSVSLVGWGVAGGVRLGGGGRQQLVADGRVVACEAQVLIVDGYRGLISNLRIIGPPGYWGVMVKGGTPVVASCLIKNGLAVQGGSAKVVACTLDGSDGDGLLVDEVCRGGGPQIFDCVIRGARVDGVALDAHARLEGCVVQGNGRHGIRVANPESVIKLEKANRVHDNARRVAWGCDIYFEEDPQPLCEWEDVMLQAL